MNDFIFLKIQFEWFNFIDSMFQLPKFSYSYFFVSVGVLLECKFSFTFFLFLWKLFSFYSKYNEIKNCTPVFQTRLPYFRKLASSFSIKRKFDFQKPTYKKDVDLFNSELFLKTLVQFYWRDCALSIGYSQKSLRWGVLLC